MFVRERAFARFPHETQALSKVTGIADLTAWQTAKAAYQELAPTTVKKLLTGSGKADKAAVAAALESYVGPQTYATDDESDAAATGIAWSVSTGWIQSVSMSDDSRFLQSQPIGTNVDQEGSP